METNKYKVFKVTLSNGQKFVVQSPAGRLTEKYASLHCYHWINKMMSIGNKIKQNDVISITGII